MTRKLETYRTLVLLTFAVDAFMQYLYFSGATLSNELVRVGEWNGYGAVIGFSGASMLYYAWMFLHFSGLGCMFFYWSIGKWLFLAGVVLGIPGAALSGLVVLTPLEMTLSNLSYMFSVFALGMAFFSPPVLARFRSTARADA